jgi:hypothetical protein
MDPTRSSPRDLASSMTASILGRLVAGLAIPEKISWIFLDLKKAGRAERRPSKNQLLSFDRALPFETSMGR